jgi:general secretion pathway protein G
MRSGDPETVEQRRGFTLVEMLMVVLIVSLLVAMAIPVYQKSLIRTREDVLRGNLLLMRTQIDEYVFDKQKGLQSLQDLVTDGYLRAVPVDPMTGNNQSWKIDMDDALRFPSQSEPGIFDVHSGSSKKALDGTPYSDW